MKSLLISLRASRYSRGISAMLAGALWLSFASDARADFPTDPASVRERQLLLQVVEELELILQSVRRAQRSVGAGGLETFHYSALLDDLRHMRDGVLNHLQAPSRVPRPMEPLRRVYSAFGLQ